MNAIELQNLIFPKYQEFVDQYGHCPNTLLVGYALGWQLAQLTQDARPVYAGMAVGCCASLDPNDFKLGILL